IVLKILIRMNMDIRIVNVVLDVFDEYGETIRFDLHRFEEAINDEARDLLDECYLVMLGFKYGIFDALIFDEDIDIYGYVQYLKNDFHLKEEEALFLVSVLETILDNVGYYFEIPDIDGLAQDAYQRNDFYQLAIIAKTYFLGFGVQQDYEKAFEIYSYLYTQEYYQITYYLGFMYEKGYGIEKNIEKALLYYHSYEDDLCHFRLGVFYMLGQYVQQDAKKALEHLSLSHHDEAYLYQGILLEKQGEYALAFDAFREGAKLYQPECLYKAGIALKYGIGVQLNLQEAHHYFEYGYYLMHGDSAYELSVMCFDGLIDKKNSQKAMRYLVESADLFSQEGCFLMGKFYECGMYVKKDTKLASQFFQKASEIREYAKEIMIESFEDES
ncbi:MAG: tetratricopeptide repeat protein, partial [Coprobacillus sp.]